MTVTTAVSHTRAQTGFFRSAEPEPHVARAKQILKQHPDVRDLAGSNSCTFLLVVGVVAFQFVVAWLVRDLQWWWIALIAYGVGAFASHALWVMIHENAHRLVFPGKVASRLCGIFANLPLLMPASVSFEKYHLRHHAHQGIYELDADMPSQWEIQLFSHSAFGRACWFLVYIFIMVLRPIRLKSIKLWDGWLFLNAAIIFGIDIVIGGTMGFGPFLYLALSSLFSVGLHPVGARWIQEHYTDRLGQETFSYYGPLNLIQLNVGYHNEHHDFAAIPWNRLPQLKKMAPEMYDTLASHRSWARLMLRFIFSGKLTLESRIVRTSRTPGPEPVFD